MRYFAFLLALVFLLSISAGAQTLPLQYSSCCLLPILPCQRRLPWQRTLRPFRSRHSQPLRRTRRRWLRSFHASLAHARARRASARRYQRFRKLRLAALWRLHVSEILELPGITPNMNGFNYSVVYYWKDWFGVDGEFAATHATQDNVSSWFLFGGGGPRFRWSAKKGVELWAHALVGYSHFTPQTPAGNQHAFAYELGGGVDLPFKPRWALRLGADAMCTAYFSTLPIQPHSPRGRRLPLLTLRHRQCSVGALPAAP